MVIDELKIILDSHVTKTGFGLLSPEFSDYTAQYIRKMVFSRTKQLHETSNIAIYSGESIYLRFSYGC
jgi:hypothetical protein